MGIQILSKDIVEKIAAGEVVERPASVVKELVENALDAGATVIHIHISGDAQRSIRITDNGSGIRADEVEVAFARHATSKLTSADDLFNVRTLGFRGEALASIASVSHVTLTTRHMEEDAGTFLRIEGGELRQRRGVGAPNGTVIGVEQLFYNTPARLKFLKGETAEKRHIANVITRYAMAYPHVRFTLEQDGREQFRTNGSGDLLDVIAVAMGLENLRHMIEVSDQSGTFAVSGYTSATGLHRADRSRITLFVNGRWIQDTSLTYAVVQAYHTLLMGGRYPVAVLRIDLPPADVDVNVHPAKAEVRFRDPDGAFAAVQRAVRRAVVEGAQAPNLRGGRYAPPSGEAWQPTFERRQTLSAEELAASSRGALAAADQLRLGLALESPGQPARRQREDDTNGDFDHVPEGVGVPARPRTLPMLRVVGQIGAAYIIAEGPAGMYLIDQHAAHERILYEQFMADYAAQGTIAQFALAAQTIQLPPGEAHLLEANLDSLSALGFVLEPFGPNVFIIRGVPAMLADHDPVEVISGIVSDLEQGNKPGQASIEDKIVLRVCKQAAVKAGQILSHEQMQGLIRQLERCAAPLTCPHGRPTLIHMSSDQLAREFGRLGA